MMVRKLAAALLGVGVMVPGLVQALGLGGIKLNSALSEPLDAEIELVQVRELTEEEILPSLASNSDFSAAGVEKYHFLTEMKFDVVVNPNGRSYIKVTSRKPMKEPFVNFLVEVHWPEGRLLREYTMLLDPPVYRAQTAPTIQRSTVTPPRTASRTTSQPISRATPASAAASSGSAATMTAPASSGQTYGPTGPSDSLWGIASQLRPSSRVNVHQTMLAIQRLNPQAFVNGNINLLKRGQVLRAPSEEDALSISSQDAIRMVAEQNRAWREKAPTPSTAQAAPVDATGKSAGAVPARVEEEEGKLSLVSPAKTEVVAAETAQGGEASGTGGVLRDKLAMAEETTDKFKLENEDLKLKLNDLQQQTDTTNQVLKLKDDQIAALQAKMAELQAQLDQVKSGAAPTVTAPADSAPPADVTAPVAPVTEIAPAADTSMPAVSADASAGAAPASEPTPSQSEVDYNYAEQPEETAKQAPAAETSAPTTSATSQVEVVDGGGVVSEIKKPALVENESPKPAQPVVIEPSLVDEVFSNWFYLLGLAGLGVAGIAGWTLSRRKKADASELDEALVKDFALPAQANEPLDNFQQAESVLEAKTESPKEEAVPQTGDVVGEADIYIAYGRFTQAAEMLEKAAAKEPGRDDIRLKLLEVAAESKNPELFDRHAVVIGKNGNAASVARMESLRAKLGSGAAAAAVAAPVAQQIAQEKDEDIDSLEELEFDAGSIDFSKPVENKGATESVGGLDFSLDFRLTDAPVEKPQAPKAEVADENSLDFDLEMDLEKEFSPAAEVKAAPIATSSDVDMEALEFEGDFNFSPATETAPAAELADEDHGIELELAVDEAPIAELADNETVDFELVDDIQTSTSTPVLAEDDDVRHAMDFENEDTIDSSSAALLADELDFAETAPEQADAGDSFELDDVALETTAVPAPAPVAFTRAEPSQSEEDLDFITDGDEASTKLDLARAYIDMGDREGARDILDEVLAEGNAEQQREARELLARLE